jgi:4-carboxymuconolactone decarboxylase
MPEDASFLSNEPRIAPIVLESARPDQVRRIEAADPALVRLNLVRTVLRNEQLFDVSHPLGCHLLRNASLPFRDREILICRIAWLNASQYVFTQHVRVSKSAGMTDEEIADIKAGSQAPVWSDFDRALLEAVEQLRSQNAITYDTWATLSTKYDEKQLIELIVLVGQYNTNSWLTNALQIQLEEGVVPQSMSR